MGSFKKVIIRCVGIAGAGVGVSAFRNGGLVSSKYSAEELGGNLRVKNEVSVLNSPQSLKDQREKEREERWQNYEREIIREKWAKEEKMRAIQKELDEEIKKQGLKSSDFDYYPNFVSHFSNDEVYARHFLDRFKRDNCLDGLKKDCDWLIRREEDKRKLERARRYFSWPLGYRDFEYREHSLDAINVDLRSKGISKDKFKDYPDFFDLEKYPTLRKVTEDFRRIKKQIENTPPAS